MKLKDKLQKYNFLDTASKVAEEVDVEVYVVGGFIRDLILNKEIEDIAKEILKKVKK